MEVKFPIKTKTSCQLKWVWNTLYLNSGKSFSCHRTGGTVLTEDNFDDFHNTLVLLSDRKNMLNGEWPTRSCSYCRQLENQGSVSDRIRQWSIPYKVPQELEKNPTAISVTPTVLEVYFSNVCNMGCLYCTSQLSSVIEAENTKFGDFLKGTVKLVNHSNQYQKLLPLFWKWLDKNGQNLYRLNILGGEPFFQQEFNTLLEYLTANPMPECELNVVTNLKISKIQLEKIVQIFRTLLKNRHIRRVDITCSIDCWGPEQEYVRYGMDLRQWEENFNYLITQKWLTLNINQTISPLTIKTMPELLRKLHEWRQKRKIGHWFSGVSPQPDYLKVNVLGGDIFDQDFNEILYLMPDNSNEDQLAKKYMEGIYKETYLTGIVPNLVNDLFIFLDEKDRRRNTNWRDVFPWLVDFENKIK